ncbi:MAG: PLDc N-terminal domain-containing protein [Bacteroidaceae bacterium]|nr:PLDc N-terminal domain-containing protein [Bacteroides sp.]MBQ8607669.1 PLDc N-terminal domain-containing protein [Bacteroidaceae bacterium]
MLHRPYATEVKVMWGLLILLFPILGMSIYYFVCSQKR